MARRTPIPTRLREFVNETTQEENDGSVVVTLKLRCPRCGESKFVLFWQHVREAGRLIETSPVWIACGACRYHALLFDDRTDGLNGFFDDEPVRIPECKVVAWAEAREPAYGMQVVVQYDIDPVQIDEAGEIVPDAYDWITIVAVWSDESEHDAIDFETA